MSEVCLRVEGLHRSFGRLVALAGVDLTVAPGELVGLVGHNGAGKSTLMSIVTGRLLPTAGRVHIRGVDVHTNTREALTHVGLVAEEPALLEHLSAREMLALVGAIRGSEDIDAALQVAALGEDAERPIAGYSQGMRRRTAIAAALVGRPSLLVLDEALNGLDPPSVARTAAALRGHADAGGAVLVSTHVADVLALADRVVVMAKGRVVADVAGHALDESARRELLLTGALGGLG